MIAYGQWQPYVDAEPARQHVQALRAAGLGRRRIAQLAGVPASAVAGLLYGQPGRPPARRLRPGTAARLLAVQPGPTARAAGTPVDAAGTQRRLQALVALGHPQATLARRLGMTRSNFGAMMRRPQVTAATARAATRLYGQLWDTPPPVGTPRARAIAAQARAHAAARGWPPPLAWDDDTIDNPAAGPASGWQRTSARRPAAGLAADAGELITGQGYTRRQAAERLGVTPGALTRALTRTRGTPPTSDQEGSTMFDPVPRAAPEYVKGAAFAHQMFLRQHDAGVPADQIAARHDAAVATLGVAARNDAEREFLRGFTATGADHLATLRDAQQAKHDIEQWERDSEQEAG
jgi:hypothetical protein